MLNSSRRGISYPNPDRSDRPDIPAHVLNLVNALEVDVVYAQGTNAQRVAAAHMAGVIWRETDTGNMYWDTGAAWVSLGPPIIQDGLYANRPLANAVPSGTRYYATDTYGTFRSDGAAWTLINQFSPLITVATFGAAPWTAPYDGMEVKLQVDATNGIAWHFRYNGNSASAYKWEFVGGDPLAAWIDTTESYTAAVGESDATTPGPSVTVPRNGEYEVETQASTINNGGSLDAHTYLKNGVAAASLSTSGTQGAISSLLPSLVRKWKLTLVAGVVMKLRYGATTSGAYQVTAARRIGLRPFRIS